MENQFYKRQLKIGLQCLEENLVISPEAVRNYPSVLRGKSKKTKGLF